MKVALCFIINYEHILNKEHIWREWIEPNKDIINVYFYYKDLKKITSPWIIGRTIPPNNIVETSYYHVVPAYISILSFALSHDKNNDWFCLLTDSCCPIISPKKFKYLFYENYNKSIFSWREAWWNVNLHKRSNLHKLPKDLQLANDPWFTLKREHVNYCLHFVKTQNKLFNIVCNGGLANESVFAIILYTYRQLNDEDTKNNNKNNNVICKPTHIVDWSRMTNSTSPHIFVDGNHKDLYFIEKTLNENNNIMFIRKIAKDFPDKILEKYIYEYSKYQDDKLILKNPFYMKQIFIKITKWITAFFILFIFFIWFPWNRKIISYITNN